MAKPFPPQAAAPPVKGKPVAKKKKKVAAKGPQPAWAGIASSMLGKGTPAGPGAC